MQQNRMSDASAHTHDAFAVRGAERWSSKRCEFIVIKKSRIALFPQDSLSALLRLSSQAMQSGDSRNCLRRGNIGRAHAIRTPVTFAPVTSFSMNSSRLQLQKNWQGAMMYAGPVDRAFSEQPLGREG
jgi:hypothetical protein